MSRKTWIMVVGAVALIALASLVPKAPAQVGKEKDLYVVTHIDVTPNFAADTAKEVAQFATDSRKD